MTGMRRPRVGRKLRRAAPGPPIGSNDLLTYWDRLLVCFVPRELRGVEIDNCLAEASGMDLADVRFLRYVRDRCAHPVERGWPYQRELDKAMVHARTIWLALAPPLPDSIPDPARVRPPHSPEPAGSIPPASLEDVVDAWAVDDEPDVDTTVVTRSASDGGITVEALASELGIDPLEVLDRLEQVLGVYVLSTTSVVTTVRADELRNHLRQPPVPPAQHGSYE